MRWTKLPEFDEPPRGWELSPLQREVGFVFGQSPDSEHYNEQGEGIPFLQGNADFTETFPQTTVYTRQAGKKCEAGDTLISVRAPVGELCRADQQYALGRGVAALRPLRLDSDFFFHAMSRWRKPLQRAAQGSTFDAVTGRHFSQLQCLVPPPAEQTRIAETLKAADDHIRALEEQTRKAKRVFRALLNDRFNGLRSAPKIKGRQCFTLHGYVNFDESVVFTADGQTAYFKVDDFNSPGNERQLVNAGTRVAIGAGSKSVPFEAGNVIFAKRGAALTKNRVRINAVPCFLDPNLMLMRPIPSVVEATFLRYYLMFFRLEKLGEDAGIPQLNNKDLYPKEFPIPGQSIRNSICDALFAGEDLVDAVNAQLAAARCVKQSLLQNLLTGKIRLKA